MNTKDNRRVRMTKQLLKDTLLEMLETNKIEKISIRELCQKADINRSTFYKYYGSQYDLLSEMEADLLGMINKEIGQTINRTDAVKNLENVLSFVVGHTRLCKILINEKADRDFQQKLLGLPSIMDKIDAEFANMRETDLLYAQKFILFGGYNMVVHWLNTDCRETPEELAGIIMRVIGKVLK